MFCGAKINSVAREVYKGYTSYVVRTSKGKIVLGADIPNISCCESFILDMDSNVEDFTDKIIKKVVSQSGRIMIYLETKDMIKDRLRKYKKSQIKRIAVFNDTSYADATEQYYDFYSPWEMESYISDSLFDSDTEFESDLDSDPDSGSESDSDSDSDFEATDFWDNDIIYKGIRSKVRRAKKLISRFSNEESDSESDSDSDYSDDNSDLYIQLDVEWENTDCGIGVETYEIRTNAYTGKIIYS